VVRAPTRCPPALRRAQRWRASGRPVLLNVWLDKTEFREGSLSM
jgi:hypothetical protein